MLRLKRLKKPSEIPGFGLTLGITVTLLCLVVLIPLSGLFVTTSGMSFASFWSAVTSERAMSAYRVSLICSLAAAAVNVVFGMIVAWMLVRYRFPGKAFFDALVDLPFALPTAVAGIALSTLYAPNGWIGQLLTPLGIKVAFAPLGIFVALVFIGLPFVVRTVQPILQDMDPELEEAASSLGASRWQTFVRVILPQVGPALLTGFAMAFARGFGEYGSVIFISGNIPRVSEIVPLLIVIKLEQYDYAGATALAAVMLTFSFLMLYVINALQSWSRRRVSDS